LVGSWLSCLQNLPCLVRFWCMRGGDVEVWTKKFYIGSWRAKLILAPLGMPKWVWPSMNRYRMFFVQTSTIPPCMHQKLTKHGRFCKQNNQLPTKSHVELKDNSIVHNLEKEFNMTRGDNRRRMSFPYESYGRTPGSRIDYVSKCH
jgi:hypothetical protein